jgi:hypothetical protein
MSLLLSEAAAPSTPATGKVYVYAKTDGRVYAKDDAGTETAFAGITSGTAVTASGTSVDFTGIPAGTKRITIMLAGLSTNGTSAKVVQIGDSGGVENTGYLSNVATLTTAVTSSNATASFLFVEASVAARAESGDIVLTLLDSATNTWAFSGLVGQNTFGVQYLSSGSKSLSAVLDRVRITTANGTDTFDAGSINILYE